MNPDEDPTAVSVDGPAAYPRWGDEGAGAGAGGEAPQVDPPTGVRGGTRRRVIIEPVLALFVTAYVPSMTLISQFVYTLVASRHNLTAVIEATGQLVNGSSLTCVDNTADDNPVYDLQQEVQNQAAKLLMIVEISANVPAVFTVVFYGAYSDQISRKLPIIVPLVGQLVKCVIFVVTLRFRLPILLLMVGSVVEGLTGGMTTMMMSCMAYLADVCDRTKRTIRMTAIDVACGVCVALAQLAMGFAVSTLGYMYPFLPVMGLHLINLVYVIFFVPDLGKRKRRKGKNLQRYPPAEEPQNISPANTESVSSTAQSVTTAAGSVTSTAQSVTSTVASVTSTAASRSWSVFDVGHVTRVFRLYSGGEDGGHRWTRVLLLAAMVCCDITVVGRWDPLTLYFLNSPLCWAALLVGGFMAWTAVCNNLGAMAVVAALHRRIHEHGLAILGCLSAIVYFVLLPFCVNTWSMFLVAPVGLASSIPVTMVRAMNSKITPQDQQGALFSALGVVDTLCSLAGSIVFNPIYGATLLFMKGFVFLVMAGIEAIGLGVVVVLAVRSGGSSYQRMDEEIAPGYDVLN